MSDLSLQLQPATSPLSVDTYFDPALYEREMATLFASGPRYVGHELSVPQVGDYCTLSQEGDGRVLVHNANGIELLSNVCRHRQAVILQGQGNLSDPGQSNGGNIVCPLHRWT